MSWHIRPAGIIISILWSGFTVWAIRKLWRVPLDARSKTYHAQGKWWGLTLIVGLALYVPLETPLPGLRYLVAVLFLGFIGLPITIIGGYMCGRIMQAIDQRRTGK